MTDLLMVALSHNSGTVTYCKSSTVSHVSQTQAAPFSICDDTREAKQVSKNSKILTDSSFLYEVYHLTHSNSVELLQLCRTRRILKALTRAGLCVARSWSRTAGGLCRLPGPCIIVVFEIPDGKPPSFQDIDT